MKKWYRIAAVVVVMVAVIAMVIISGVRRSGESEYTRNTITMGTAASFTVYGSHGSENIDGMLKLIDSLDKDVLSWRSADSEIYRVNTTYKITPRINASVCVRTNCALPLTFVALEMTTMPNTLAAMQRLRSTISARRTKLPIAFQIPCILPPPYVKNEKNI